MSTELLALHPDKRPEMTIRSRIFGHPGAVHPFQEGIVAKVIIPEELAFYWALHDRYTTVLTNGLIPEVVGLSETLPDPTRELCLPIRHLSLAAQVKCPVILLKDLATGYEQPSILDIKLGIRTWPLGEFGDKCQRHRIKCGAATVAELQFRVRAAIWRSDQPDKWECEDGIHYITREFGNACQRDELESFLIDFLKSSDRRNLIVPKLRSLHAALSDLRREADTRLYSSSVVVAYDNLDPEKIECRLLDFAKAYFNVTELAEQNNEKIEDCEDGVLGGLENLIQILEGLVFNQ
jgi:hypothetical protein